MMDNCIPLVFTHAMRIKFSVHQKRFLLVEGESIHLGVVDNPVELGGSAVRRLSNDTGLFQVCHSGPETPIKYGKVQICTKE